MKKQLNDRQTSWLNRITTTNLGWLKTKVEYAILVRIMVIKATKEYDVFDRDVLNDIREEWIKDFTKLT